MFGYVWQGVVLPYYVTLTYMSVCICMYCICYMIYIICVNKKILIRVAIKGVCVSMQLKCNISNLTVANIRNCSMHLEMLTELCRTRIFY